jgi:hypothetical protein
MTIDRASLHIRKIAAEAGRVPEVECFRLPRPAARNRLPA